MSSTALNFVSDPSWFAPVVNIGVFVIVGIGSLRLLYHIIVWALADDQRRIAIQLKKRGARIDSIELIPGQRTISADGRGQWYWVTFVNREGEMEKAMCKASHWVGIRFRERHRLD